MGDVEAEHVVVKTKRPFEVGNLEVYMSDAGLRVNGLHGVSNEADLIATKYLLFRGKDTYVPQFVPADLRTQIKYFFDIYDAEEKRM